MPAARGCSPHSWRPVDGTLNYIIIQEIENLLYWDEQAVLRVEDELGEEVEPLPAQAALVNSCLTLEGDFE